MNLTKSDAKSITYPTVSYSKPKDINFDPTNYPKMFMFDHQYKQNHLLSISQSWISKLDNENDVNIDTLLHHVHGKGCCCNLNSVLAHIVFE